MQRNSSSYSGMLSALFSESLRISQQALPELDLANPQVRKLSPASALQKVKEIGPRVYELINHQSDMVRFCVLGCQGEKGYAQKNVANLMNEILASRSKQKPDFMVILGDNIYDNGVDRPDDPRFQSQFHDIYGNPSLSHISQLPCFVILGNHDGNRHNWEVYKKKLRPFLKLATYIPYSEAYTKAPPEGEAAEINQVAHTLLSHPDDPSIEDKVKVYTSSELDLKKLQRWNMPYFFYSIVIGKLQIFCLNSNTYVKDFLELLRCTITGKQIQLPNQAVWLREEYAKAKAQGRTVMFAQHHPLFTCGKRRYPGDWDAHLYLNSEDIQIINRILELLPEINEEKLLKIFFGQDDAVKKMQTNGNYNDMLTKIYQQLQEMFPDLVCAAHDHSIYYYNNAATAEPGKNLCQVISGGGGGKPMDRKYFGENENLGCFFNTHGFFLISCNKNDPRNITIEPYTTMGNHLIFNNQQSLPVRDREIDPKVGKIRDAVFAACKEYLSFLNDQQNVNEGHFFERNRTHRSKDVDIMHQIECFLDDPKPASYEQTIITLYSFVSQLENKDSPHSVYKGINEKLKLIPELSGDLDFLYSIVRENETNPSFALM